ncbi:MAG: T9SS type A sorting domain-containing protein [Candidatus Cyclobacteriaceae bacterium M2_1C_046]
MNLKIHNNYIVILGVFWLLSGLSITCFAQDGSIDPDFYGRDIGFVASEDPGRDILAVQDDGKIIVFVQENIYGTPDYEFQLMRFNPDGTDDLTFGTNGIVRGNFGETSSLAFSVALQADGKIVVVGESLSTSFSKVGLARYNSDGTLDLTFGTNGTTVTDISSNADRAHAIAVQPDGYIVVGGYSVCATGKDFLLLRYNTDGLLDGTFGSSGLVYLDFNGLDDEINAIELQPDGKIVAAGYEIQYSSYEFFAVARFNIDGSIDTSFGSGGTLTFSNLEHNRLYDVKVKSSGEILVVGESIFPYDFAPSPGASEILVEQLTSSGSFDGSFSGFAYNEGGKTTGRALQIQFNDKILAGGAMDIYSYSFIPAVIFRLFADGNYDPAFGSWGYNAYEFTSGNSVIFSMKLHNDGNLLVAGWDIYRGTIRKEFFLNKILLEQEVVPVELINFTGSLTEKQQVLLKWSTASELNNDYFEVQHSVDGKFFNHISQINGKVNSEIIQYYNFIHKTPSTGSNYYRLKQVDFDGTYEYYNMIHVEKTGGMDDLELRIFSNPSISKKINFFITTSFPSKPIYLNIKDLQGRIFYENQIELPGSTNEYSFDLEHNFTPGIYIVSLEQERNKVYEKLLVKY